LNGIWKIDSAISTAKELGVGIVGPQLNTLRDVAFIDLNVVTRVASNFPPGYCGISKVPLTPDRT